jgi:PAT family beta-lactamase induction signal transducer AmpG
MAGFVDTFRSFFQKPGIGVTLGFLLLYRLGEAQLLKMAAPFLLDPRTRAGWA